MTIIWICKVSEVTTVWICKVSDVTIVWICKVSEVTIVWICKVSAYIEDGWMREWFTLDLLDVVDKTVRIEICIQNEFVYICLFNVKHT